MKRRTPPASPRSRIPAGARDAAGPPRHGLARTLSKLGVCSRTEAARWIANGRVQVDGRVVRDPEFPIVHSAGAGARLRVDGQPVGGPARHYLMLNKPRGLVTTTHDEQGRDTVYRCFEGSGLPWLAPVGRLDKASEGLLLFSNDPQWAAAVTDPAQGPEKTYHVQVDALPTPAQLQAMREGIRDQGEWLRASRVELLRSGERHAWLEVVLDEGRNRQIRRLLASQQIGVLRLVRVAIGGLLLGDLPKGAWRALEEAEWRALVSVHAGAPGP